MWVLWCLGTLVGTSLVLSLIDSPAAWMNPRNAEEPKLIKAPAPL
jgi:hypothetical protein